MGFFHPFPIFMHVFCDGASNQFQLIDFRGAFSREQGYSEICPDDDKLCAFFWYYHKMFHSLLSKRYFGETTPENPEKLHFIAFYLWFFGYNPDFSWILPHFIPWNSIRFNESHNKIITISNLLQILRICQGFRHFRWYVAIRGKIRGSF